METIETDLLWLFPLLSWVSGGCEVGIHGMEPARPRVVFPGEMLSDEVARWPRREAEVGVEGGGARRLEGWELAVRCCCGGGFNWDCVVVLLGPAVAMFLKQMVQRISSPA